MSATTPTLWWLVVNGQSTGPNSEAFIQASLQTGVATADQLACPVGGDRWQPLRDWPQFKVAPNTTPASCDFTIPNTGFTPHDEIMVSLTGWLSLGGWPALLVLSFLFWAIAPSTYALDTPQYQAELGINAFSKSVSLLTTIFGMVGGYRLLERRRESVYWISGVFVADFLVFCIETLAGVVVAALASPQSLNPAADPSAGLSAVLLLFGMVILAAIIFQVYSLIWLWQIRGKLKPL
jgi:uncharacterized protein DUF4339